MSRRLMLTVGKREFENFLKTKRRLIAKGVGGVGGRSMRYDFGESLGKVSDSS